MIGPHEGRELELMLAGEKHLAMFHDAMPDGGNISEEIIPEKTFSPYVASGQFIRIARDFVDRDEYVVRYVCFTATGHTWRAEALFWITDNLYNRTHQPDDADDIIAGRLLGYCEAYIAHFIEKRRSIS